MKFLPFLLLIFSNRSWSQSDILKNQLEKVLMEVDNGFNSLKGNIKNVSKNGDSSYYSTLLLEGTINTEIEKYYDSKSWSFHCRIGSSNLKDAKKNTEVWMKKLKAALSKTYKIKNINEKYTVGGAKGYSFIGDKIKVSLFYTIIESAQDFSSSHIIISKEE